MIKILYLFMFRLIFVFIITFFFSCSNDKKDNVNTDLINNQNTFNNPERSQTEGPILQFKSKEHDFGTISEGEIVLHTFQFENTGKSPLIISDAVGSCGCTTPTWSNTPIKPGESGYIEVKFDSKGRVGANSKTVTLTANTIPNKTYLKINVHVKKL